jgi:hypothetical protein
LFPNEEARELVPPDKEVRVLNRMLAAAPRRVCLAPTGSGFGWWVGTRRAVGGLYLYGALGNLWATRGRHPGWMLMAAALILIAFGVNKSPG